MEPLGYGPDLLPFVLPIRGCGNPWHWFNIFHPYWGMDI